MSATSRPWEVYADEIIVCIQAVGDPNFGVAICDGRLEYRKHDAELIVRAVNAHDLAVRLAEAVLESLPILEVGIPEKGHGGSCVPGITSCDGSCMDHAYACAAFAKLDKLANEFQRVAGEKP